MLWPRSFRRRLALRLVAAAGVASFAAQGAACSPTNAHAPGAGGAGGRGGSSRASSSSGASRGDGTPCAGTFDCPCWQCACDGIAALGSARACAGGFCPTGAQACDPVCSAMDAGLADASTVTCADVAAGGGGTGGAFGSTIEACFPMPDAGGCPTSWGVALNDFLALGCPTGFEPFQIVAGPTIDAGPWTAWFDAGAVGDGGDAGAIVDAGDIALCCYSVHEILCGAGGRLYREAGRPRVAGTRHGRGAWGAGQEGAHPRAPGPVVADLDVEARRALAAAWTADALAEHASVASFARFSLALMAFGAPAGLVADAHAAAIDEVRHAGLCFAIASAYAGEEIAPGPLPTGCSLAIEASLSELAASTVEEACVGEVVAAVVAAERARAATDPFVRATLERIAADEARHASLAWRTLAWAVGAGGEDVRAAVTKALRATIARHGRDGRDGRDQHPAGQAWPDHGILSAGEVARATRAAIVEVIAPAAFTLLRRAPRTEDLLEASS